MSITKTRYILSSLILCPYVTKAQSIKSGEDLVQGIATHIVNPIIRVFFAVALAFFLWGVISMIASGEKEEARQKGRDHILWGLVGMGIMIAAFSLLKLVTSTFGVDASSQSKFIK